MIGLVIIVLNSKKISNFLDTLKFNKKTKLQCNFNITL